MRGSRGSINSALAAVPADEIRHAFTSQQLRRGGDFERQMRLASISGTAHAPVLCALDEMLTLLKRELSLPAVGRCNDLSTDLRLKGLRSLMAKQRN